MNCPEDERLACYVHGGLAVPARREISNHLRACEECRRVLFELDRASSAARERPPGRDGSEQGLTPGAAVGRHVVLKPIGRGGMGVVALAYDPELDRRVALKLLREGLWGAEGTAESTRRLRREAQAMAKISHPNVVTVYDVGELGDRVFVTMEFVEGTTLRRWLRAEARSFSETLSVCLQAGRGLAAVHAAGLIHRDVKPENILIRADGRALVTDLGLARQIGGDPPPLPAIARDPAHPGGRAPDGDRCSQLTRPGVAVGTPAYMAPEQRLGLHVDARTDQFGFCATVYEALYGQPPFAGETPAEIAEAVLRRRLTRPSGEGRRVPGSIRRSLARGLRADPRDRYPSMGALLAELEQAWLAEHAGVLIAAAVSLSLGLGAREIQRAGAASHAQGGGPAKRIGGAWDPELGEALRRAFTTAGRPRALRGEGSSASRQAAAAWPWERGPRAPQGERS